MTFTMKATEKREYGNALYKLFANDSFVGEMPAKTIHKYVKSNMKPHDVFVEHFNGFAPDKYTYQEFRNYE